LQGRERVGVQLSFDEYTHRLMLQAIDKVTKAKGNRLAQLRDMFYNRSKTWRYDSNYRDLAVDTEYHDVEDMLPDEWRLKEEPLSVNDSHSNLRLNINARMSITYNWKRFFANAYGQFVRFSYKDGDVHGRLNDWYVNTSLGVRF